MTRLLFKRMLKVGCFSLCVSFGILVAPQSVRAASEKVVATFKKAGSNPTSALISVDGVLYGTTSHSQASTLFRLTPNGKIRTIAIFPGGGGDASALVAVGKLLYGVIEEGGDPTCNCGYVYSATKTGKITVLHSFTGGKDGAYPIGSLIELNGVLYGTAFHDGKTGGCCGTVFRITPKGGYRQLYKFRGRKTGDGAYPIGPLTAVNGTLYGTTSAGNRTGHGGVLFSLSTEGTETVLHSFGGDRSDGFEPNAGLFLDGNTLYGTTSLGGKADHGVAYSVALDGTNETVLHVFGQGPGDGLNPNGGLISANGLLYGTTIYGGTAGSYGTVFSLTETGDEAVVYAFKGTNKQSGTADAEFPKSTLLDINGSLYGTSFAGGRIAKACYDRSCGTIFQVTP